MLDLRPNCENCDKDLPPDSSEAFICTYECTFCRKCVELILENVCPNCGGNFCPRPIRPVTARRNDVSLTHQPASSTRVHTPYTEDEIRQFAATAKQIQPWER
ncbi:DUF1272 domain-containing protein [Aliamphritea ceti]|uniref:DUF1272 domain-containing protein n=1 Tax=Aliamphritea ceti TaxID=1524258 RepID=UPI0021C2BEC4|nr:DUF1272 domain-containing protein [Aliamphritea ceti]